MKQTNRNTIAAYVAAERHLRGNVGGAKTLTQIAAELGTNRNTLRRWLRRDHWELWMNHWASVDELWEASQQERLAACPDQARRLPPLEDFCASRFAENAKFM